MIVKPPAYALGSPQDDTEIKFDSDKWMFFDANGNTWTPDELAACRPGNAIRKWLRENFPRR